MYEGVYLHLRLPQQRQFVMHQDRGTWAYYSLIYRALTRGCIAIVVTL